MAEYSIKDLEKLSGMKIVANPGNGAAGPVIQSLMDKMPIDFVPVHFEADGTFPNGVPNPLLPENRQPTFDAIVERS